MKKSVYYLALLALLTLWGCAPSRYVEPLEKDEVSIGGHFGGPVITFGGPIPLPLTSVDVGYGLDSNITIFGGLHTTAIFFGNLQLDAGATYQFLEQRDYIPNLSVSPSFNFIYNFEGQSARFWPILDLNAYWNYGQNRNYFYAGCNNYFELSSVMANDQPQAYNWLFNPQIGHVFKGATGKWQLSTELKLLAPYIDNSTAFVPYASLTGSRGAAGLYISYRWIFGKNNEK